jgi:hypothetical protein
VTADQLARAILTPDAEITPVVIVVRNGNGEPITTTSVVGRKATCATVLTPDAVKETRPRGVCAECGREAAVYGNGLIGSHKATRVRAEYQPDGSVVGVPYLTEEQCAGTRTEPAGAA